MVLKGKCIIKYILDKEPKELVVEIELQQVNGFLEPFQNVWKGIAMINDNLFDHPDLSYCVNAQLMAERIAWDWIEEKRIQYKNENKNFRLKRKTNEAERISRNKRKVRGRTKKVGVANRKRI